MNVESYEFIRKGRRKRHFRWILVTASLVILSGILSVTMLVLGNSIYPFQDVVRALAGEQLPGVSFAVNTIRLPRMLAGLFAGFAFGLAGNTFQTMLRNPLANPNVLGITTGSSAAAVFFIVVFRADGTTAATGSVMGGLATVLAIYLLSKGNSFSIGRLILVGIGIQAMLNALISYLLLIGAERDLPEAFRWLSGSLNGSQMHELLPLIMSVVVLAPVVVVLGKHLSIMDLGEQSATSLGVDTDKIRMALIFSSVCMLSLATATTGPIAFVSFLAGPIAKRLVGTGFSNVIPAGLVGANLVLAADLIGQFAFEVRYPVGIITGIIGAPYLVFLLVRMNRKGELQ